MTTPITLHLNPLTVNSIKMLLICNALEIDVDYKHIRLHKGDQRTHEFLKLNPDAKVPVLVDGDLTLTESNAILQYLAAKHHSPFWPSSVAEQAKVLKVLFWQSNYFNSALGPYAHRRVVMPQWGFDKRDITDEMEQDFHKALTALENILEQNPAVAGDNFTIADISVASFLIFAEEAGMPLNNYIATLDWLARLKDQPWFSHTQRQLKNVLLTETKELETV
ncbi:MAG: glutathione S-transferase family protein [Pseudomonadales bacterium]|nr:glutathione S-transferase family protein [Pseudomonadales bacterium]